MEGPEILLIEPFYGGSHKQLMDLLSSLPKTLLVSLPAKKWPWRARTSALYLSQEIPEIESLKILFTSSVLNLAELVALRPDLSRLRKIIYFHENQLIYPVQKYKDRDFQFGYNQILSCLVADHVFFNSHFNMTSFLDNIQTFLHAMPDYKPRNVTTKIRLKCDVLYFPVQFRSVGESPSDVCVSDDESARDSALHILWPHRWEHDKNPELFFQTLIKLKSEDSRFKVSILGEQYSQVPAVFDKARDELREFINVWGYQESREEYYKILAQCDVVVSTAQHEFYGVAMLEAVHEGCIPVCPNRLVYPEIYPAQCLYNTDQQLYKTLKRLCDTKRKGFLQKKAMNLDKFSWTTLKAEYEKILYC